ncbi:MAG: hypothetical protein ACLSAP_01340 [Oscillospiraceae bacterium]
MKKKVATCIAVVLALSAIFCVNVFAVRKTITLGANQVWTSTENVSRSGKYSYGSARCYSVYPVNGGLDFFDKIQVQICTTVGVPISQIVVLSEKITVEGKIPLMEGYLNQKAIIFKFRGNGSAAAKADVYYSGN